MMKSFREWLGEGESIYATALTEYQGLEQQLQSIEQQLTAKRAEVNQIAQVIGKPALEVNRRVSAEIIEPPLGGGLVGNMTRALTGRGLGR